MREWEPDLTYQYKGAEMREIYKDYYACNGVKPIDRNVNWESKEELRNRIEKVINKYKTKNKCVIFVFHQTAMQSVLGDKKIEPAEIVEYNAD